MGSFVENVNKMASLTPANVEDLNLIVQNIDVINQVAPLADDLNDIIDNIIPNLAEILDADNNAIIATEQALLATTNGAAQVALATTQTVAATEQATIATTQAVIATTKAGEASTSASNALTSRNEAEGFRDEAEVFASSIDPSKLSPLSIPASRLLAGGIAVTNTIVTQGMNTTLYTGNGSTQSITTGIDMTTQWGNDASEKFGGLVWVKSRSTAVNHILIDSVRGDNYICSNTTNAQVSQDITDFTSTGFNIKVGGAGSSTNENLATYAAWVFQTTHRVSGTTNHGKAFTCHYNPFTGFTMVKYEGSGLAGHEIPHFLGRKLGFTSIKSTSNVIDWDCDGLGSRLSLNATTQGGAGVITQTDSTAIINAAYTINNASSYTYIMYGWANSYFDDEGVLNGNYEIGTYVGTGVAGNKVTTRGKPAWVMVKSLSATGDWKIHDNQRGSDADGMLNANLSDAETIVERIDFNSDGFTLTDTATSYNTSGGTYLYMVVYDTNANGGGTYYPRATDTSNLQLSDAQLMYSDGYANGTAKNTSEVLSGMTYPAIAYSAGYNYVKKTSGGAFSATPYEPKFGEVSATSDYYLDGKWYSSSATPLGNITYLPIKVLADANGQIVSAESWKYPEVVAEVMAVSRLPELPKHVANREYVDGVALGVGQTWQNVTASRLAGVTYTNTTGKPIVLKVFMRVDTGIVGCTISVDGIANVGHINRYAATTYQYTETSHIITDGASYSFTIIGTPATGYPFVMELR